MLISFWSVNKHAHHRQLLFRIGQLLSKSSPLIPRGQMKLILVRTIYGRFSIKSSFFLVPIRKTWPLQEIIVSNWSIAKQIFSSDTAWSNETNLGKDHLWKVLYEIFVLFSSDLKSMATTGNYCFSLVDF